MKKRSLVFITILIVLATVMPFVLGACADLKFKLAQPSLSYKDGVVSWSEIGMAGGYEVSLYEDVDEKKGDKIGDSVTLQSTKYALASDGTYWVGVRALSSGRFTEDSDEAFLRVTKKNTETDVTVPDEGKDPDDTTDPVVQPDKGDDVLPSNAPALNLPVGAVRRFNYLPVGSFGGISVALTANTDKVRSLYASGAELNGGWSYDEANNALELDYSMFGGVSEGTDTAFVAVTESGETFTFYVTLCSLLSVPVSVDVPSYGAYVFCKNSQEASEGVTVQYASAASTLAVSVDGRRIANSTTNYSVTSKTLKFKQNYLKSLSYGVHRVEVFTTKGVLDFYLFVYSSSIMCYNLQYEFDDTYPDVVLRWDVDYPIDRYEVVVDGTVYSSDGYPDRFDGNSFNLSGLVGKGSTCTAYVKSYIKGLDTPATSATAAYADNTDAIGDYLSPEKGFSYLGKSYNRYIDSESEMDILAYYMILYNYKLDTKSFNTSSGNKTMTYMDVAIAPSVGVTDASDVMSSFAESCGKYKESIKYTYAVVKLSDGAYRIGISMTSKNEALYDSTTSYSEASSNVYHLTRSSRGAGFDDFAINAREGVEVETSDQLFFAVEAGYKPLPVTGSVAEKLYNIAKDVCRTWIDDDMTDYEKVHAIYDWLGKNVVYDYNIVKEMGNILPSSSLYDKFYSYDCFYLEGVLENGVAVCNGIAKTFVLLCGIENITAVKVNGQASGGAHAWNKVLINEKWYIVDSTWSNQKSTNNKEVFTHDYLFMTTSESASDRTEQTDDTLYYYCGDVQVPRNF